MRKYLTAIVIACVALVGPVVAQAKTHQHRPHHLAHCARAHRTRVRHHRPTQPVHACHRARSHRGRHHHRKHTTAHTTTAAATPTAVITSAQTGPMTVGMGDVYSIGCENLPIQGANVVRIVVSYYDSPDRWLSCAQNASHAGYRIALVIQYNNRWSDAETESRFQQVLSVYAPYAWSVSVGNEQEGPWVGGIAQTGARYAQTWQAVEPIIAAMTPNAIRVAGEITPWGFNFLQAAVAAGLPGAQALAAHVYPANFSLDPATFAAFAHENHMQAWATEGLCGPNAWTGYGCRTAGSLQDVGIDLAAEWYVNQAS